MNKRGKVQPFYGSSVFGKYGLASLITLLGLSIFFAWVELIWVVMSCLIILLVSRFWARWSLEKLTLAESVSVHEVFPEEEVTIEFQLHNKKNLPVPWVHLQIDGVQSPKVESELEYSEDNPDIEKENKTHRIGWISGKEKLLLRHRAKFPKRGIYKVNTAKLVSGDPFSLYSSERILRESIEVIVYPKLLDFVWPEFGIKSPNGNISDRNFIFTDPAYKAGLRDYLPTDSLKSINWAASARFQTLKSNLLEGKAVSRTLLFLNGSSLGQAKGSKAKGDLAGELLLSGVAALAVHLASTDKEWDFMTDVVDKAKSKPQWQQPERYSTNSAQKIRELLVRLARVDSNHPTRDPLVLLKGIGLQPGLSLAVFSAQYDPALASSIQKLGKFRQIRWFVLDEPTTSYDGEVILPLKTGWTEDLELEEPLGS